MLAGEFAHKLKFLNPRLNVFAGNDASKPAGIWYLSSSGEYEEVCGIDKNYVTEFVQYDSVGHIIRGGWLRALKQLIKMKLIDQRESYKVFGNWEFHRQPPFIQEISALDKEIACLTADPDTRQHGDLFVDVAKELNKRKADHV